MLVICHSLETGYFKIVIRMPIFVLTLALFSVLTYPVGSSDYLECMDGEFNPFCESDGRTYLNNCFLYVYKGYGDHDVVYWDSDGVCEDYESYDDKYHAKGYQSRPIVVYPPPGSYQPGQRLDVQVIPNANGHPMIVCRVSGLQNPEALTSAGSVYYSRLRWLLLLSVCVVFYCMFFYL